ncbi:hypothetical protein, partial [Escherichia coli]|uniref:hypothetical protein n=1 Tax=Escherichia coli TaxID=562 RepID=UPI003FA08702
MNGITTGLQPVFDGFNAVFDPLAPSFDAIGSAISCVWDLVPQFPAPIPFSLSALETFTPIFEAPVRVLVTSISG